MKYSSRKNKFLATFLLVALVLTGLASSGVRPAHAASVYLVNLDANSASLTDFTVETSATDAHTFRVGAVINATSANPLLNVQGFEFTISYNASAFVPQGDPDPAATPGNPSGLYVDGAANTVLFGANPNLVNNAGVTENWNALLSAGAAFRVVTISPPGPPGTPGTITVAYSILGSGNQVKINGPNLLANVAFELVNKPSTLQSFKITNVIFVDNTGSPIAGVLAGNGATETITNDPPRAMFTAMPFPQIEPLGFLFNATGSRDGDGTITSPSGYFWDFGDGTQDLGVTGVVTNHNFTIPGIFNVTLRVADNLGATGAARDSLGGVIINTQPSHISLMVKAGAPLDKPPVAIFTFTPANPTAGQMVLFDGSASFDPDGVVINWIWNFGDGFSTVSVNPTISHAYSNPGNYSVTLTVEDNGNARNSTTRVVNVSPATSAPAMVAVNMNPNGPPIIQNSTVVSGNFTVNVDVVSVSNLFGWQFQLSYNNTALATSKMGITLGPYWQNALATGGGFAIENVNSTAGTILIAFALINNGQPAFNGTGILANIKFAPLQPGLSRLHLSSTILVNKAGQAIPSTTQDGFVLVQQADELPIASFTFTPTNPSVGDQVFFDGSRSSDPDGVVTQFMWTFGDGIGVCCPSQVNHAYFAPGNYTVMLTVFDSSGQRGSVSHIVNVQAKPPHDVAIAFIDVSPQVAISSSFVEVEVGILNTGLNNETVSLTVYANNQAIATVDGIFVQAPPPGCVGCQFPVFVPVTWDTLGVAAGNYTISATVFLSTDPTPADNSKTDGTVNILPPPTITLTPSSGGPGTKVLVQGSGFAGPRQFPVLGEVDVSFDDDFLGFTLTKGGTFNFTLDVPLAQPGPHLIKVFDVFFGTRASAVFTVTTAPATGGLAVSVNVGTVYFPQDKVAIYVLATLNGAPVNPASTTVTAVVINPDGTTTNLALVAQTNGLYMATLTLSKTATIGTYAILAKAHMAGPLDATSVATFEVRLPWLSTNTGQATVTTAAIAGIAGMLAVFWKKGYIRRRDDDASAFPF
jgi:PKD repeat protein